MKVGRYLSTRQEARLGAVVDLAGQSHVIDVARAHMARNGRPHEAFASMATLMAGGYAALEEASRTIEWATIRPAAAWLAREQDVQWLLPLEPRNVIAGGMNFARHREEVIRVNGRGQSHTDFPMGFVKLAQSMVPTRAAVARPRGVVQFDYEIEVAAVIGSDACDVDESRALEYVFGYTIMNDLSARELQMREMANQSIVLGKNFPGFGPLGPWILTADEVPDPSVLALELRVNGQVRQRSTCRDLIFGFPAMVSHWSRMGLASGDVLTTGTPEGIALARKPDPSSFFLKPGDVVEAEVPQIGILETRIVEAIAPAFQASALA